MRRLQDVLNVLIILKTYRGRTNLKEWTQTFIVHMHVLLINKFTNSIKTLHS